MAQILMEVGGPGSVEAEAFDRLRRMMAGASSIEHTEPVWQSPGTHSLPITNTRVLLVAPNPVWAPFLTQVVEPNMVAVIRRYVATTEGAFTTSSIEFRLRRGREVVDTMQFTLGIEKHKEFNPPVAGAFPAIHRQTFFVLDKYNPLVLDVRNLGGEDQRVIAAFYGWNYVRNEITGAGEKSGAVDNQAR